MHVSWTEIVSTGGDALSQVNFTGSRTLDPDAEVSIGDISATGFLSQAAEDGVTFEFILRESLEVTAGAIGDYNSDGRVDAGDYVRWRNNLGGAATELDNRDPVNMAANAWPSSWIGTAVHA